MSTATLPAPPAASSRLKFARSRGIVRAAHAIGFFGTGGIGKSTLASAAPGALVVDIRGTETSHLDCERVGPIATFSDLLELINGRELDDAKTIVIDNMSDVEAMAAQHVIATIPGKKQQSITTLKDYGYGEGESYLVRTWRLLLAALDRHRAAGRNVVLVMHETTGTVPNPNGEDYLRYQPRLYHDKTSSVLMVTKEWLDHLVFISYDIAVKKDGTAQGGHSQTMYFKESATHMAKNRALTDQNTLPFPKGDTSFWNLIAKPIPASPDI